ncbi:hypothetical protein Tco_0685488 [Tanacetum coccineum]
MELKYQNQALKDGQHGQILNETSNKAKIKKEIEVLEKINIELEHSVAKLLAENEKLHKENEHLKQTYKDLYDSIKKTRTYLRKNELRKLKGNSVDTKFAKPSILGKPVLTPPQETIQLLDNRNALNLNDLIFSKTTVLPSQVDVNTVCQTSHSTNICHCLREENLAFAKPNHNDCIKAPSGIVLRTC